MSELLIIIMVVVVVVNPSIYHTSSYLERVPQGRRGTSTTTTVLDYFLS